MWPLNVCLYLQYARFIIFLEIPLPNEQARMDILKIHAGPITKHGEIGMWFCCIATLCDFVVLLHWIQKYKHFFNQRKLMAQKLAIIYLFSFVN
jgi:SpoVK/Ycf46/Vps4 family AAA+-type ATPase